jgi:hypothetical protein
MTPKQTFYAISFAASGLAIWLYIVTQVPANIHDFKIMAIFFVSLTMWLGSIASFGLFRYRVWRSNGEVIFAHIKPAMRQGSIIALTITLLLFLQVINVINWWETLLVIVGAFLFERALNQPEHSGKLS